MKLKFDKLTGCGNSYIFLTDFDDKKLKNIPKLAKYVSDKGIGIGGDGLILLSHSDKADFKMRIFNSDGSEGKMCGNGIRCSAKLMYDNGICKKENLEIETLSGIKKTFIENDMVIVDMGTPRFTPSMVPINEYTNAVRCEKRRFNGKMYTMTALSMGNPHCVFFDEYDDIPKAHIMAKYLVDSGLFPNGVNTGVAKVKDKNIVDLCVYERGSGYTNACGTGACACAVASVIRGYAKRGSEITVNQKGGSVKICWSDTVLMKGDAVHICSGEIILDQNLYLL